MSAHSKLITAVALTDTSTSRDQIYLIDDDTDMRRALHILQRATGIEPLSFANAELFLNALTQLEPAPLLLNLTLSRLEGIRLLRALAALGVRWPVVVMGGVGELAVAERAMDFGPISALRKPFSAEELELAVRTAFRSMPDEIADSNLVGVALEGAVGGIEQKIAENEVDKFRRALGPFVVAAEATRMPMAFTNATAAGNPLIFANDSFLALTGYKGAEVVGQSFDFLMSAMADPEAIDRIATQFVLEKTETIEVDCRDRQGHTFLAAIRINPVHDGSGKIVQHCISFVSLGDHVERMRQEREALHELYQHTPDFIVTMEGPQHRFTFANDAFQRLVNNRGIIGTAIADAMPELVDQGFVALLDGVFSTGEPFTASGMPVSFAGGAESEPRFLDFIFQAVRDEDGNVCGIFCEGHDATEQKLAGDQVKSLKAELTRATRASAMDTMLATLAHELNQPLTAISNYAAACSRLIDLDADTAGQFAVAVSGISAGARRAGDIIRRLRDMSQKRTPDREVFDLQEAAREAIALVQAAATLHIEIDDTDCRSVEIQADRVQIEQVIINLVRNACQAARSKDGRVKVSISVKEADAVVSVQDNGSGVSLNSGATLFERVESAKLEGMGIGLSICRGIIEEHHGQIWLESGGDGANFCFSLPVKHPLE